MFFFLSLINVKVSRAYLSKELDNFTKILIGIEFCLSSNFGGEVSWNENLWKGLKVAISLKI